MWKKTNEYGNYLDPKQNHKDCYGNRRQASVIKQVREITGGKHIGSKPISVLINHLS